ncbi:MAG: hypothetical protein R6U50_14625 [Desulfobacterales bacterium]
MEKLKQLLSEFGKAFFKADANKLQNCTTTDIEWHLHKGSAPTGTVLRGVEAICKEIVRRKAEWKETFYEDFDNRFLEDMIVSSFLVSGVDEFGKAFKVRAVDLYHVRNGKISRKDSYWKNVSPE